MWSCQTHTVSFLPVRAEILNKDSEAATAVVQWLISREEKWRLEKAIIHSKAFFLYVTVLMPPPQPSTTTPSLVYVSVFLPAVARLSRAARRGPLRLSQRGFNECSLKCAMIVQNPRPLQRRGISSDALWDMDHVLTEHVGPMLLCPGF